MKLREITGGGKDADQAKGKDPMPKAKGGRKKHPLQHQLVGDSIEHELDEMTSAGAVASVAMPMGQMVRRKPAPKRRAKKKK